MRPIRRQIAWFMSIACLIALLGGALLTVLPFQNQVRDRSAQELRTISRTMPVVIDLMSNGLAALGRTISSSNDVVLPLAAVDEEWLTSSMARFLYLNQIEYAEVTDPSGTVILNFTDETRNGQMSKNPLVRVAMGGNPYGSGILRLGDQLFVVVTVPVPIGQTLVGTLSIGRQFDGQILQQFGTFPGTNLAIWQDPRLKAIETPGEKALPPIDDILTGNQITSVLAGQTVMKDVIVDGREYQCAFFSLPELGGNEQSYFAAYRALDYLSTANYRTMIHIAAFSGAIFLIISQFIYWLSRRVSKPIEKLTAAAERMRQMEFEEALPITGKDEISKLSRTFNELSKELQENIARKDHYAAELAHLNENLERTVSQRTEELEHSNLRLKKEITEKNDFLRAISHDLGAPVRNIGGLVKLLEKKYADIMGEEGREKLTRIKNNIRHELEMIEQLVELSRLRTREGRSQNIDLMEMLASIRSDLSCCLDEKEVMFSVQDVLPAIRGDRHRIRQLFQNLIDNAVKYMGPQPAPQITLGWSDEPDHYLFWIADNGIGIPADQRDAIFSVFNRVKNTEALQVEGRGIGLATAKTVVELYGGEIWVESTPGEGSTFYFTLDKKLIDLLSDEEASILTEAERELADAYADDITD